MKKPTLPDGTIRKVLANHELVVLAAYLAGAESTVVDTEDIAIKANELAPGRFTWRKYKDQINIDTVRKRLWDATKPETGAYLSGSEKVGWRLTKAGFDFASSHASGGMMAQPIKTRASQAERSVQTRELNRMMSDETIQKIRLGLNSAITKNEAERFFRIDDYVTGKARAAKIERFRIIATDNSELAQAIKILSKLIGEG